MSSPNAIFKDRVEHRVGTLNCPMRVTLVKRYTGRDTRQSHYVVATLAALFMLSLLSSVGLANPFDDCTDPDSPTYVVAGCSAIIESDRSTDRQRAMAFNNRGNA